jgi:glycosyltransferase involved in cell wall biosynthesis
MKTKRGILLLGNYPPPFGGVPTHLMYLADHLAKRDWQVHIVPGNNRQTGIERIGDSITVHRLSKADRLRTFLDSRLKLPSFAPWRKLYPGWQQYLAITSLLRYLKKLVLEHDVRVISAYHVFGAATLGAIIAEEMRIPLLTSIFGEIYSDTRMFLKRARELDHVARYTARWLSCSEHCARSLELLGIPAKAHAVHYGIDTHHFHPGHDGTSIRRRYGISPSDRIVIFVGRMKAEMGLGVLLQTIPLVLRQRQDIHFIIVGSRGELTEVAREMSACHPSNVHIAKDAPYGELPLFYAAATLSVAPSINARACLGLAIAEALASGRPAIGCDAGGTREVLTDGEVGKLIPPHDPFALRDAILGLIDDDVRLALMGQRGREHVARSFDKDLTNQRMEEIIEEVCSDGPAKLAAKIAAELGEKAPPQQGLILDLAGPGEH